MILLKWFSVVFFCNFCAQSYCVLSILRRQSTISSVEKNTVVKAGVQKIGCYLETVFKVTVSRENGFCIFQMVSVKLLGFFVSTGCKTGFYFLHLTNRNLGRTLFDRYVSVCWLIGYDCYADCRTKIHLATVRVCQWPCSTVVCGQNKMEKTISHWGSKNRCNLIRENLIQIGKKVFKFPVWNKVTPTVLVTLSH